jgi:hypothetical protein
VFVFDFRAGLWLKKGVWVVFCVFNKVNPLLRLRQPVFFVFVFVKRVGGPAKD